MVGIGPSVANSDLLRGAVAMKMKLEQSSEFLITDNDQLIIKPWGRAMEPAEVCVEQHSTSYFFWITSKIAEALERVILTASSGQFLVVHPDVNFYWPETSSFTVYSLFSSAAMIWAKLGGYDRNEPVQSSRVLLIAIFGLILYSLFFHFSMYLIGL